MCFVTKLNEVNFEGYFFIYCKMASIQRTEALSRKSTFYSCSCINTHSKSLINRTVQACLQDSAAAGRLISCQPTQMTSAEVTQHESCVDGDTWFLSLWVIGIIFHLSAQHYLNWWRPCVWCGCTTSQYRQSSTPSVLSLTLSVILLYLISAVKKL